MAGVACECLRSRPKRGRDDIAHRGAGRNDCTGRRLRAQDASGRRAVRSICAQPLHHEARRSQALDRFVLRATSDLGHDRFWAAHEQPWRGRLGLGRRPSAARTVEGSIDDVLDRPAQGPHESNPVLRHTPGRLASGTWCRRRRKARGSRCGDPRQHRTEADVRKAVAHDVRPLRRGYAQILRRSECGWHTFLHVRYACLRNLAMCSTLSR